MYRTNHCADLATADALLDGSLLEDHVDSLLVSGLSIRSLDMHVERASEQQHCCDCPTYSRNIREIDVMVPQIDETGVVKSTSMELSSELPFGSLHKVRTSRHIWCAGCVNGEGPPRPEGVRLITQC